MTQAFQPSFQPDAFQEGQKVSGGSGVNYTLDGSAGTYTLTGQSATVKRGYSLSGNAGTYTLTGQSATVNRGYSLSGNTGVYTLTGQDATATYTPGAGSIAYTLDGSTGIYTLTGQAAEAVYTEGATDTKIGGDDAFHHTGWDKQAYARKKKQEDALEETIRATYLKTLGIEPDPEIIEEVREAVQKEVGTIAPEMGMDYSPMLAWLAEQERLIAEILRNREEDDEETLLLLI